MTRIALLLPLALSACGDKDADDSAAAAGDAPLAGTYTLECTTAVSGAPYVEGDTETFVVSADGSLTVGGDPFTGPTDAGAARTWTDGAVTWELSDVSTGVFNEFNLYDSAGTFQAQFTEGEAGGTEGGAATYTLEATGGSTGGSTAQPYTLGQTTEATWDGAGAFETTDDTYGTVTPSYVGPVPMEGADASRFVEGHSFQHDFPPAADGAYARFEYIVKVSENTTAEHGLAEVEVIHTPVEAGGSAGLPATSQLRPQ